MSSGEFSVEGDGSLKFIYRFTQKSSFTVSAAKDDMQLWTVAKLSAHTYVDLLGRCELMLLEVSKSQGVGDVIIVGGYSQRCLQFSRSLIKIPHHEITFAEHLVGAGALGIGA